MSSLITTLTLIFVTSSILLFILGRLSHPAIPSYILAGIVLGVFIDGTELMYLAQLGIVFLVFLFGIKTEQGRVESLTRESIGITFVQVTVIAGIVYVAASAFGLNNLNALYLSIAAALSSSLVGLGLVEEELHMSLLHGRLTESINLIQDLIGIFLILVVSTLPFALGPILNNILYGVAIIIVAIVVRDWIFPWIAEQASGSRELLMLAGITTLIGFLALSEFAFISEDTGISLVVGAFAAGIAVSRYPYKLEMMDMMGSLKDFFSAIFFVVLGVMVMLAGIDTLLIAAALVGITSLVKPGLVVLLLVKNGYDTRTAFLTSMGLDHVSEFALIVAIQANIAGTITGPVFQAIILAAVVTMILSSYTSRHAEELYQLLRTRHVVRQNYDKLEDQTHITDELEDHIVLVGYGVQGKLIAEALREEDTPFVVVDNNPEEIIEASQVENNTVFGNVLDHHTLDRANVSDARLIVSTVPRKQASKAVIRIDTDADVILRATTFMDAEDLIERGALYVDVPDLMAAEQMATIVNAALTDDQYLAELRRRNLLELRRYFYSRDSTRPDRKRRRSRHHPH